MDTRLRLAAAVAVAPLLSGCYYGHLLNGQVEVLSAREPIAELIASPATDPHLRRKLERALDARRFASRELGLPDNASYTSYADLRRSFAVWNVFAAPELSLQAHERCYPMLGCLAYRGYYDLARAEEEGQRLRKQGLDAFVAGVAAYSTLGWFDDPLLSTMRGSEEEIAGAIFHELAHQVEFASGDTAFNESFATFVEEEGLRRYLKESPELVQAAQLRQQREAAFVALVLAGRERLEAIYTGADSDDRKRTAKREAFERLRQDYAALKEGWGGESRFDGWFAGEPNNARLLPFGLYHQWVPAFAALFRAEGGDWPRFYRKVAELADLDSDERQRRLEALGGSLQKGTHTFKKGTHTLIFGDEPTVGGTLRTTIRRGYKCPASLGRFSPVSRITLPSAAIARKECSFAIPIASPTSGGCANMACATASRSWRIV